MERGNECMSDREEIGRVGERCTAMRLGMRNRNRNGMGERC